MKRNILIIVSLVLVAIGIYLKEFATSDNSADPNKIEFAIEDVDEIDRIEMKTKGEDGVTLSKVDGVWMVNETYPAFEPVMDIFLNKTLNRIKVQGPVPNAARDNVIRSMVGTAIKVIASSDGKELKSYYVGGSTANQMGTYLHMQGSETPYIGYIPGFDGYITPKYSLNKYDWYDRSVFDFRPEEISSITVTHFEVSGESFTLTKDKDSTYSLSGIGTAVNQQAAKSYFALFSFKNFEGFADYLTDSSKQLVKEQQPFITIKVTLEDGSSKSMSAFHKGDKLGNITLFDNNGAPIVYDQERYFALFAPLNEIVTIQEYNFGELMVKRSDFLK